MEESRMQGAQGDGQNWEGNNGGINIMSKMSKDSNRNSKAGDKELPESRSDGMDNFDNSEDVTGKVNKDGSLHGVPGAGRDGEDGEDTAEYAGGCNEDKVTGDVGGCDESDMHEGQKQGARGGHWRGGRGSHIRNGKRKAAEKLDQDGPSKRWKIPQENCEVVAPEQPHRSGRSRQKIQDPKQQIEYKPLPGYKGYFVPATPKKKK
ncbi:hypothetical protein IW262DRAFT_1469519 [Armillaria fumosa]|nr:hypothetical protein IW262DRAFT_1469519 [Armillaria fumosa]